MTYDEVKAEFKRNNCELLEAEYVNTKTKMRYVCECGEESEIAYEKFKVGRRCKSCGIAKNANSQRHSHEYVRNFFEERGCVLLSAEYHNTDEPLDYRCECGNISKIRFYDFKKGKRCKSCGNSKVSELRKFSYEYVRDYFKSNGCELLSSEYRGSSDNSTYQCECGTVAQIRLGNFQQGQRCMDCAIAKRSGENNHNYNPNLTDEDRSHTRNYPKYYEWRLAVYQRDKYKCRCCGKQNVTLHAHHLDGYNWNKERRTDVSNGITLCKDCHTDFHRTCGYGNNTEVQFFRWCQNKRTVAEAS